MKLRSAGILLATGLLAVQAAAQAPAWTVEAGQHEYTMSVTAAVRVVSTAAGDRLCAFVDADPASTCRGVADAMLVGSGSAARHLFFVTVYGETFGETIRFRLYDASLDSVRSISDSLGFSPDAVVGDPSSPQWLNVTGVSTSVEGEQPRFNFGIQAVWPNPASKAFSVRFASDQPSSVEVFDALGRRHAFAASGTFRGEQEFRLDGSAWPPGLYVVLVTSGDRRDARTLTIVR